MKFFTEDKNFLCKSNVAINAIVKVIRKYVRKMKANGEDIYGVKDDLTIYDEKGNAFEYMFIIQKNSEAKKNDYYKFDYEIQLFKKLALK